MRCFAAILVCGLFGGLCASANAQGEADTSLDWVLVPNIKFNEDAGFVYGVKTELVRPSLSEAEPFDWELRLKATHSTKQRHEHRLNLDIPGAFGSKVRLVLMGEFVKLDDANFFGIGNDTSNGQEGKFHQYSLAEPRLTLYGRRKLGGGFFVGAGLSGQAAIIKARPGTLLETSSVTGVDGSHALVGLLTTGIDTRDNELTPYRGMVLEVYLRGAHESLASSQSYAGWGVNHRGYITLADRLVIAQRLMLEGMGGDPPLAELGRIGGSRQVRGLGGVHSQRGFVESRFIGETKFLSNTEMRFYTPKIWQLCVGMGPFLDVSRIYEAGDRNHLFEDFHLSAGAELTINWKDTFLMRLDYAVSEEGGRFYIQSRHVF